MAMKVYSVLMFITAIAFGLVSVLFLCGETGWLRSFKMARYTDEKAYAKLIGKSLLYMAFVMIISGMVNLFTKTVFSIIILAGGFIGIFILLCKKARKFY